MAFSVTPTSGAQPYTFEADLENKAKIDNDRYVMTLRSTTTVGSCPAVGAGTNLQTGVDELIANGVYVNTQSVPDGSCRTTTLQISDNFLGVVVSSKSVNISNV